MKITTLSIVVALQAGVALAASFPASISREALQTRNTSDRVTVGFGIEQVERDITFDDGTGGVLDADSVSAYLGVDVLPWLTVFGTVGGAELDEPAGTDSDANAKLSGGVCLYVWEADILEPVFMAGRLTLKPSAEIAYFSSDSTAGDAEWTESVLALRFGYERFDRYPTSSQGVDTSLALYLAPVFSYVTGTRDTALGDLDFDADEEFGVAGGFDIFIAPTVSVGMQFMVFEETSLGASMRFHL